MTETRQERIEMLRMAVALVEQKRDAEIADITRSIINHYDETLGPARELLRQAMSELVRDEDDVPERSDADA